MIEISGLGKRYGAVQAVNDVSFSAADGRVTALLGPNGAGKSTTLRILSTTVNPDAGAALVDGISVTDDPLAVRRRLGVLPHNAGAYERLTAKENVEYFGRLHDLPEDALTARCDALSQQLEMQEFFHRRCAGFSQGQRIKVALARALVHDPKNVVLDEPTNGLDVMATRALRKIILSLKNEGRCVLFSSHIMQEVANLCDDVVIIGSGQVRYNGSIDGLREHTGVADLEEAFLKVVDVADA